MLLFVFWLHPVLKRDWKPRIIKMGTSASCSVRVFIIQLKCELMDFALHILEKNELCELLSAKMHPEIKAILSKYDVSCLTDQKIWLDLTLISSPSGAVRYVLFLALAQIAMGEKVIP